MNPTPKIYIAGHKGMVGSAIHRCLAARGYTRLIGKTHAELDLIRQQDVEDFFDQEKPEYVVLASAKVGGIGANSRYRGQFIYDNMMIQSNVISAMPTNLYGPGDNYHPKNSHVLPALIRRMHEAKQANADTVTIWGTGSPLREFLYVGNGE
jgi:nucleoside-diphosphate-sugar epimerase